MIKIFTTTLTLLLFVSSCGTTQKVGKNNQTQKLAKRSIASALPWSGVGMLVLVANPVSRSGETDSSPINLRTSEGRISGKTLGHLSYAVIDINESRTIGNQLYFIFKGEAKEGENGD